MTWILSLSTCALSTTSLAKRLVTTKTQLAFRNACKLSLVKTLPRKPRSAKSKYGSEWTVIHQVAVIFLLINDKNKLARAP